MLISTNEKNGIIGKIRLFIPDTKLSTESLTGVINPRKNILVEDPFKFKIVKSDIEDYIIDKNENDDN
jgi:hypothetical protein